MKNKQNLGYLRHGDDRASPGGAAPADSAVSEERVQLVEQPRVTVFIYADAAECSSLLVACLSRLGRTSRVIRTPLDVIVGLQDSGATVDAVFASLQDDVWNTSALFYFLKDEYPQIRRIAFTQRNLRKDEARLAHPCQDATIRWDPCDRRDLGENLKNALGCIRGTTTTGSLLGREN